MEQRIEQHARDFKHQDYRLLRTVPGIGKILALTILYETIDIKRFASEKDFVSYSRLVYGTNQSVITSYSIHYTKLYERERIAKCPFGTGKPVCNQCTVHSY